jgi:hypothetical protein
MTMNKGYETSMWHWNVCDDYQFSSKIPLEAIAEGGHVFTAIVIQFFWS